MSLTELPSMRLGARVMVLVLPVLGAILVGSGACTSPQLANGQACLKSQDCVSGICSQLVCAAAPPETDAEANAEAAPAEASTSDVAESAAPEAAPEAAPAEAGPDASGG